MIRRLDAEDVFLTAGTIENFGAMNLWEALQEYYPSAYNMLLLASLEMQAKELAALKGL